MSFEMLLFDVRDGVAHVTLNREKEANAIDLQLAKELMDAAIRCDEDPAVRAVLIGGRGRVFCAGGDLRAFASAGDEMPAMLKEMTTYLHAAISRFARAKAPVIAAVSGAAAGAGLGLVCAADLAICGESAKFTMAYTRVGLVPDASSTYHLPRLIGARRAIELMMTNRLIGAQEALEWGLVNRVVPDPKLAEEAEALAAQLAAGPGAAFGSLKSLVLNGAHDSLESQMELEARAIADAARRADAKEGIQAFLEKRAPEFTGGS